MRIAIYINNLLEDDGWNNMIGMLFRYIANNQPQNEFIFITNFPLSNGFAASNIINIIFSFPNSRVPWLKFWHGRKLASLLKKHTIDMFIHSKSNLSFIKTPQVVLVKDPAFLQSSTSAILAFQEKRFSIVKAFVFFTNPLPVKLLAKYPVAQEKVIQANFFADPAMMPMDWQKKEAVKNEYSEGKEFFLYEIDDSDAVDAVVLLKAFSNFKKLQQSNMQLLLIDKSVKHIDDLIKKISTFKYRNEVRILEGLAQQEIIDLQAAAYCKLLFTHKEMDLQLLNMMQIGVPVIILQDKRSIENETGAYLFADVNDAASIAAQMKIIYKDENLRSKLIANGFKTVAENTIEAASVQVWQAIVTAIKKN